MHHFVLILYFIFPYSQTFTSVHNSCRKNKIFLLKKLFFFFSKNSSPLLLWLFTINLKFIIVGVLIFTFEFLKSTNRYGCNWFGKHNVWKNNVNLRGHITVMGIYELVIVIELLCKVEFYWCKMWKNCHILNRVALTDSRLLLDLLSSEQTKLWTSESIQKLVKYLSDLIVSLLW